LPGRGRQPLDARFIISAASPEQFPPEPAGVAEVAFLGRSNVGKSSLLNVLAGVDKLAYTSSRPGRTQAINFFQVDGGFQFVDLPGYGYAAVPLEVKREWEKLIESYLRGRRALKLCLVLLDARRGWMESDRQLREWLEHYERPYRVVATKYDKLKTQRERQEAVRRLRQEPGGEPLLFSAVTGRGARENWQAISKIKEP
jgi:GTP-binding protein